MSLIREQIKAARLAAGMTQAELATILGVAPSTVVKYEKGTIALSTDRLEEIMAACNWCISFSANQTEPPHFTIGEHIRHARKSAGLSQILNDVESERERQGLSRRELAIKAGLAPSTLQTIVERNRGISLAMLLPILYALGYELKIVPKPNNP